MTWLATGWPQAGQLSLIHLALSLSDMILSVLIALPLGVLANRRSHLGRALLSIAGLPSAEFQSFPDPCALWWKQPSTQKAAFRRIINGVWQSRTLRLAPTPSCSIPAGREFCELGDPDRRIAKEDQRLPIPRRQPKAGHLFQDRTIVRILELV